MSSLAKPSLPDSDSEDDGDYVPPAEAGSDSDDERKVKRARTASPEPPIEDAEDQKKAREALWADFQASVSAPQKSGPPKLVKIEKRYRFAGEEVVEVVEVPEDSPDAKKWPLVDSIPNSNAPSEEPSAVASTSQSTPTPSASSSAQPPAPPPKRRGPRKPKTSLAPLPSASTKAKKLTTLEKSAMDWRAHVGASEPTITDELEANRRGGGYLEKVEFLQRVEERKEGAIEAAKAGKRRRG
ncbi:hypothetical protein PLICRDRAFT_105952 [Plicaturopsis crispa FD-325 SS-3]|nr:hypothetical protein PLICRDRAFT_105952 [Plicaturopsis crispa FD-325 SS-3]